MNNFSKILIAGWLLASAVMSPFGLSQSNDEAKQLFQNYQDRLYQIRTIDIASGSKSSIGSAFAIDQSGQLATNYHVISSYILHPEKYQLEAVDSKDTAWPITVKKIDVINDLALVLIDNAEQTPFLKLAIDLPEKGDNIYSLGNPRDLGMTVVPGTFNGTTSYSYYGRILFSGSINPGMSGGPVLNGEGEVIGVNVATSGNQISFLVPLKKLLNLIHEESATELSFSEQAYEQLQSSQAQLMAQLLNGEWNKTALGDTQVVSEITHFISCWGRSQDHKDDKFREVFRRCRNNEYIYIAPDFYTGTVELEFFWYESKQLSSSQFYQMLSDNFGNVNAGNMAGEDHVTEFRCQTDFVDSSINKAMKAVYCVREYKQFPGLYDALFVSVHIADDDKSLISHFTVSGIERTYAQQFLSRFMEHLE